MLDLGQNKIIPSVPLWFKWIQPSEITEDTLYLPLSFHLLPKVQQTKFKEKKCFFGVYSKNLPKKGIL